MLFSFKYLYYSFAHHTNRASRRAGNHKNKKYLHKSFFVRCLHSFHGPGSLMADDVKKD